MKNPLKHPKECCPFYLKGRCIHKNHIKTRKKTFCVFLRAEKCPDYRNTNSAAKDAPEGFKIPNTIPTESIWSRVMQKLKKGDNK